MENSTYNRGEVNTIFRRGCRLSRTCEYRQLEPGRAWIGPVPTGSPAQPLNHAPQKTTGSYLLASDALWSVSMIERICSASAVFGERRIYVSSSSAARVLSPRRT